MINDNHTTPPYQVGDLYMPEGRYGWTGMVVSVKNNQQGCAVYLDLMYDKFTDIDTVTEIFDKYHLSYNKYGSKLSPEEVNNIVSRNESDMRICAYHNGRGDFLLPTIDELKNFFNNIEIYYNYRQQYTSQEPFDIENNTNCRYFLSRTLNADATEVYIWDVKKRTTYSIPINKSWNYVNAIYVLEYSDNLIEKVHNTSKSTSAHQTPSPSSPHGNKPKSGCYIATAVYGNYDCPEVWTLRRYRDNVLDNSWYGRLFIQTYYTISPTLVKWFGKANWFRNLFVRPLNKWVAKLNKKGVEDTPYKDKY